VVVNELYYCTSPEEENLNRVAMGYGLDGQGSIPGRAGIFVSFTASRPALGLTQPPIQCVLGVLSPEVKRPGNEVDHSPPFNAQIKYGGAIPQIPDTPSWRGA
jgi:hypothetical protein